MTAIYKREVCLLLQLHDRLGVHGGADGVYRHLLFVINLFNGYPYFSMS
jgi:hypothetical protein